MGFKALPPNAREWQYVVDVHGQLFLHDTVPKNLTSCFKDKKFLDFFFIRLMMNPYNPDRGEGSSGYHYLSPCGKEFNFIKSEDAPIVFQDLTPDDHLIWGGTLRQLFDPSRVHVRADTGRLYHPLSESHRKVVPPWAISARGVEAPADGDASETDSKLGLGLLRSSLIQSTIADTMDEEGFVWKGKRYAYTSWSLLVVLALDRNEERRVNCENRRTLIGLHHIARPQAIQAPRNAPEQFWSAPSSAPTAVFCGSDAARAGLRIRQVLRTGPSTMIATLIVCLAFTPFYLFSLCLSGFIVMVTMPFVVLHLSYIVTTRCLSIVFQRLSAGARPVGRGAGGAVAGGPGRSSRHPSSTDREMDEVTAARKRRVRVNHDADDIEAINAEHQREQQQSRRHLPPNQQDHDVARSSSLDVPPAFIPMLSPDSGGGAIPNPTDPDAITSLSSATKSLLKVNSNNADEDSLSAYSSISSLASVPTIITDPPKPRSSDPAKAIAGWSPSEPPEETFYSASMNVNQPRGPWLTKRDDSSSESSEKGGLGKRRMSEIMSPAPRSPNVPIKHVSTPTLVNPARKSPDRPVASATTPTPRHTTTALLKAPNPRAAADVEEAARVLMELSAEEDEDGPEIDVSGAGRDADSLSPAAAGLGLTAHHPPVESPGNTTPPSVEPHKPRRRRSSNAHNNHVGASGVFASTPTLSVSGRSSSRKSVVARDGAGSVADGDDEASSPDGGRRQHHPSPGHRARAQALRLEVEVGGGEVWVNTEDEADGEEEEDEDGGGGRKRYTRRPFSARV
ncbi:hypothetical protein HK101_002678 [Irineochytrium annulatum]|nr:hypothetical protein HK101_002678 [Irineochytrium annulatum]